MMTETSLESIALTVVAWLATYIVHSTLLIGTVWGFTRACQLDSLTRSLLWKLALVGGLFTATLQTGLGVRPLLGQLAMVSERAAEGQPVRLAFEHARAPGLDERIQLAVHRRLAGLDAHVRGPCPAARHRRAKPEVLDRLAGERRLNGRAAGRLRHRPVVGAPPARVLQRVAHRALARAREPAGAAVDLGPGALVTRGRQQPERRGAGPGDRRAEQPHRGPLQGAHRRTATLRL